MQTANRIALLIHSLSGGGAERLMSDLANRWAERFETHLVTWSRVETDQYAVLSEVTRHGLDLLQTSKNVVAGVRANIRRVRVLRKKLAEIAPDFVLSFSDQMNIVAMQATNRLSVPVWISEHSDPRQQQLGWLWETWRARTYPRCSGCVVLTEDIADHMACLVPRDRIRVIPPAIPLRSRGVERAPAESPPVALYVGRLSREKQVDLLLGAWREACQQLPDWHFHIVGDGPERESLQALATGIPRIRFLGWSSDPHEHYSSASLFMLSSAYEGFPVALLEALSHGLPCVSTDCSTAIDELNSPKPCVLKVAQGSIQHLRDALLKLANDQQTRIQLGQNGVENVSRFAWDVVGAKWDAIVDSELRSFTT